MTFWRIYLCKFVPSIIIETYIGSNALFRFQKYRSTSNVTYGPQGFGEGGEKAIQFQKAGEHM